VRDLQHREKEAAAAKARCQRKASACAASGSSTNSMVWDLMPNLQQRWALFLTQASSLPFTLGACFRHPTYTTRSTRLARAHRSRVFTRSSAPLQAVRTYETHAKKEEVLSTDRRGEQRASLMRARIAGERGRSSGVGEEDLCS
jgi:hypothetical protein